MNKLSLGQIIIIILLLLLLFGDFSKLLKNISFFIKKTDKSRNKNLYKKKGT